MAESLREARGDLLARLRRRLPRDTGDLAASYDVRVVGPDLVLSSDDPAAEAAERGRTIQGSPWVAVPLRAALRRLPGPRSDGPLISIRTADGRLFLASRAGARLDVRWRLLRSVRPPRGADAGRQAVDDTLRAVEPRAADAAAAALVRR